MANLTLYRHDMTPAAWVTEKLYSGLGRLPDAVEPRTHLAVNGDLSFTMRYPLTGSNYAQLQKGRLICAEGQLYRIGRIKKSDRDKGREVRVDALHIMYDLRKKEITNIETAETTPDGITQSAAMGLILAGTPFTVGTIDNTTTLDYLDILQKSALWALQEQVLKLWGGELLPDNWTLHIRAQLGLDRRFPIRRGINIKGIDYTEDITDLITRLHVSGYQGATFEDINGGKDYVDSPYINNYRFLGAGAGLEGRIEFPDDDEPAVLLAKGQDYLATVDVPQIAYDIDLLEIRNSEQYKLYKPLTLFGLGDSAVIHHDFFSVDITARALELERDPVLEENVSVVLGNYTKDLYTLLAGATQAADAVSRFTTPGGGVRTSRLEGVINTLQNQLRASGAYANATVRENEGYLLENTNPASADFGALYAGCGILALASEKNPDNSWKWRTFLTGKGGTADEIVTGVLQAALVKILGTDNFFWEAGNIRIIDPSNASREIRLGLYDGVNYGLAFTTNGGTTWGNVLGFNGLGMASSVTTAYISLIDSLLSIASGGELKVSAGGTLRIKSAGNAYVEAGGTLTFNAGGKAVFQSENDLMIAGKNVSVYASEKIGLVVDPVKVIADDAKAAATGANDLLADIASDSKLTASDKKQIKKEWDIIASEKAKIDLQADQYGVSRTAYGVAYDSLATYIAPLLANLGATSSINGTTFRANFKAYYDARQDVYSAISKQMKSGVTQLIDDSNGDRGTWVNMGYASGGYGGARCVYLSRTGADGSTALLGYHDMYLPDTTAGTQFTLSGWYRITMDTDDTARISIRCFNSVGSNLGDIAITMIPAAAAGSWTRFSATGALPAGTVSARVYGRLDKNGAVRWSKLKGELGNKDSDWSLSPNDPGTWLRNSSFTLDENGLTGTGALIKWLTQQMIISNVDDEELATIIIDTLEGILKARNVKVAGSMTLDGNLFGVNNIVIASAETSISVAAGGSIKGAIIVAKYLKQNCTITVAAGVFNEGAVPVSGYLGFRLRFQLSANTTVIASLYAGFNSAPIEVYGDSTYWSTWIAANGYDYAIFMEYVVQPAIRYLHVYGKVRTSVSNGTAYAIQLSRCSGIYLRDITTNRTISRALYAVFCSGSLNNVRGGENSSNYNSISNLGVGSYFSDGCNFTLTGGVIPFGMTSHYSLGGGSIVAGIDTATPTVHPSAAQPSQPTLQTVVYDFNDAKYCRLPSSASMGTSASTWSVGAPRGGIWNAQDQRYSGAERLKRSGGSPENILTLLSGKTIVSANLTVYCDECYGAGGTTTKDLYYLKQNGLPVGGDTPGAFLQDTGQDIVLTKGVTTTLNITTWLQAMLAAGTAFYGFGFGLSGTFARCTDSSIVLEITYQ